MKQEQTNQEKIEEILSTFSDAKVSYLSSLDVRGDSHKVVMIEYDFEHKS
jgi:hypothetical protein